MPDTIFIRGLDRETYLKLRELGYLVVIETEFNTDTQKYELALRQATNKDI